MKEPAIPSDVEVRWMVIHQQHLQKDFNYYKDLISSHERELAVLSLALVVSLVFDYYLLTRIKTLEESNAS